jgi:hypothetical protein
VIFDAAGVEIALVKYKVTMETSGALEVYGETRRCTTKR